MIVKNTLRKISVVTYQIIMPLGSKLSVIKTCVYIISYSFLYKWRSAEVVCGLFVKNVEDGELFISI